MDTRRKTYRMYDGNMEGWGLRAGVSGKGFSSTVRLFVFISVLVTFLTPSALGVEIPRVYYLGDCLPSTSPIGIISDDPALDVVAVPAVIGKVWWTKEEVARAIRLYLPRNYQQLIEKKMLILLSDVKAENLPIKYMDWFAKSVTDDGMSLMMVGGICSFGGHAGTPSTWDITSVEPILPVGLISGATGPGGWKPVVTSPNDPLMKALPWQTCPMFHGYNKVTLKGGATLLAETGEYADPFMASWDIGSGRSFAFCTDWTPAWGESFQQWDFYIDFTVFSMYYTMGRGIPKDLELVHLIGSDLLNYRAHKNILIALIDFVEKVGGNVLPLEEEIREAELIHSQAKDLYIQQDYSACLETLGKAREKLVSIENEAVKAKARAILWIWVVEWLVVTSTFMVVGFALWSLMVRRRLYREIAVTKSK